MIAVATLYNEHWDGCCAKNQDIKINEKDENTTLNSIGTQVKSNAVIGNG